MSATPLPTTGISGGISETGVATIDVPMFVETLAEALSVLPNLGIGIPYRSRAFTQEDDGGFKVTLHFEGIANEAPSDDQVTFELDTSMAEDPIQTHPHFAGLKALYGWDTAEERFPEKDPNQQPSPAYGAESYLAVGAVFRITTTRRTIPGSVLKGIGTITAAPPGIAQFQIPNADGNRNWLKSAPKIKRKGNAVNITEEYLLSGPKGWLPTIYSAAQLT